MRLQDLAALSALAAFAVFVTCFASIATNPAREPVSPDFALHQRN